MPPEVTENTPSRPGLGASRVTYRIEDLVEIMPDVLRNPYSEGRNLEYYWNSFSEDNFRGLAHILYLDTTSAYREHLNYIFDYGRNYPAWRDLWDNHRDLMVSVRIFIYNFMSNMTGYQAHDIANILTRRIEDIIAPVGLNSGAIGLLSRWVYILHRVYSDINMSFPTVDSSYTTLSVPVETRLRALCPALMQYISSSATQYANLTFNTLDERLLYLGNVCRTVALQARHIAHSHVLTEEEKEYIRQELGIRLDIDPGNLYILMQPENNLGSLSERRELATLLYNTSLWAPFENAFLPVPYDYTVTVDPEVTHTSEEILAQIDTINTDSVLTTISTRRALINLSRVADMVDENHLLFSPRTTLRNYLTTIGIPEDVIEILMEELTDQQVEDAMTDLYAGRTVSVTRENTQPSNISMHQLLNEGGGRLNPEQFERFREALTIGTSAPYRGMEMQEEPQGQEYRYSFNATGVSDSEGTLNPEQLERFREGLTAPSPFIGEEQEVALASQGVCNLNDLANAHSYNKNPQVEFERIKVASEQEIWEGLQKNHAGMMETIQYILDDCTIDYKETNKTKRIDKMKNEMVPRIKGVLTCMSDRLIPDEVHYINKWLWDLINFAINCNQPLPYRRLAPDIQKWDKKEEPRIKRIHTVLHIPRLAE
jgi:hypothetical protein